MLPRRGEEAPLLVDENDDRISGVGKIGHEQCLPAYENRIYGRSQHHDHSQPLGSHEHLRQGVENLHDITRLYIKAVNPEW